MFSGSEKCTLCPRKCGADRTKGLGYCKVTDELTVARCAPHFWEEPCISGKNGSGAVFFSGCSMGCVFCQNIAISRGKVGERISVARFKEICFELKDLGVHNINLVTPSHFAQILAPAIADIKEELALPIICNCSGYESDEILDLLLPVVDVFLPDLKFFSPEVSKKYANCDNYFEVALHAIKRMVQKTGAPVFDKDGLIQRGTIVRHLILPGHRKDSIEIIKNLAENFDREEILLSLMSQYVSNGAEGAPSRRLTTFEYESVAREVEKFGFFGYFQEISSAKEQYIPDFNLKGVKKE